MTRSHRARPFFLLVAILSIGCGGEEVQAPSSREFTPPAAVHPATMGMEPLAGQAATCDAPREKTFDLEVVETTVDLGMGRTFAAWTYNGRIPGPTLEVCEGDTVTINVVNAGTTSHGLDTHAFKINAAEYGPTAPGTTLSFEREVDTPGAYLYHCAAGPVTDLHIKSGLHGAMIVHPRDRQLEPATEVVVVQDAVFGTADATGHIPGTDPGRAQANDPELFTFNGWLEHEPVPVPAGGLVRLYFVNVGPGVSAMHVIGSILDRVYDGQVPLEGLQTYGVPTGSGIVAEFPIPEPGHFLLVDHDRLAYLPWGFALTFEGVQ